MKVELNSRSEIESVSQCESAFGFLRWLFRIPSFRFRIAQCQRASRLRSPVADLPWITLFAVLLVCVFTTSPLTAQTSGFQSVVRSVQPKTVKIFGAGGFRGLEAYQSGVLISSEGHVLTVWSYVLDGDATTINLDDGEKFEGREYLGLYPYLDLTSDTFYIHNNATDYVTFSDWRKGERPKPKL